MSKLPVPDLGRYLREQREAAQLSLRQAAQAAGISNPYLSQIERGLRRPSADILQQIAKGLRISAEQLYVRAGILEEDPGNHAGTRPHDVTLAILADPRLTDRQRRVLLDVYQSFVGDHEDGDGPDRTAVAADPAHPTESSRTTPSS
ncbi:helix-turn-helix domain-containing protein [Ornithinicoccus halotolerans]|uniref:helix-turn-helix domain-containing protein n=1 Tax=Ornithinicoccus halotolerans TaxID=1748220 RepID=UPI001297C9EE|nr:helix-turn-helix transcriptional regulator [Ornithinicoccus halotolerans]